MYIYIMTLITQQQNDYLILNEQEQNDYLILNEQEQDVILNMFRST